VLYAGLKIQQRIYFLQRSFFISITGLDHPGESLFQDHRADIGVLIGGILCCSGDEAYKATKQGNRRMEKTLNFHVT
jgi:hypothetical protein